MSAIGGPMGVGCGWRSVSSRQRIVNACVGGCEKEKRNHVNVFTAINDWKIVNTRREWGSRFDTPSLLRLGLGRHGGGERMKEKIHYGSCKCAAVSSSSDEYNASEGSDVVGEKPKGLSSLAKRAIFGTLLGGAGAVVIVLGGWAFAAVTCLVAFQCSQEFLGMVNANGISKGMKPPPPLVSSAISLMCVCLCAWSFISGGKMASAMAVASFLVMSLQLVAVEKPRFSQLTSAVFGLMYCGYLPSFWIKLRLLAVPATNSTILHSWQGLFGVTHATVGLVATFTAVACIIAADTGAYFFGKSIGRTQLISVSPKKTVEGALGGLLCSISAALFCYRLFQWPDSYFGAAALGVIVFISSLFGDLIESVIKRDAGLKDASNLIPGHGGLLDRLDSYLFTGACTYFFMRFFLVGFGV